MMEMILFAEQDPVSNRERLLRRLLEDREKVIPEEAFEGSRV